MPATLVFVFRSNRNTGDDMAKGIEWLEKAVASGSPPAAAYHLATPHEADRDQAIGGRDLSGTL